MCPEEKGTRPSTASESYAITGANLFHLNVTIQVIVEKRSRVSEQNGGPGLMIGSISTHPRVSLDP